MHEFSMTKQVVESVLHEARKHNAKKVVEVHLVIGRLTFLGIEQVRFSYEILAKNTILNDSKLRIEEKDGRVRCTKCDYEGSLTYESAPGYHVPTPTLLCPKCKGAVQISSGRECTIKSLKLLI
jgi:hydrogenase nickel incorporation protein HypA/HybF